MTAIAVCACHCLNSGDAYISLERKFWARNINLSNGTSTQYQVETDHLTDSSKVSVFIEKGKFVSGSAVKKLIQTVEEKIIPVEDALLTPPLDVDKNGKVILLLMDIQDGYQTGGQYVSGYFDGLNQFPDAETNAQLQQRSNYSEILYLDIYPSDLNSTEFYSTVAHEYQHLLQFSFNYPLSVLEDPWVDEGLAEIMSDITGFGPQTARADYYRFSILTPDSLVDFKNADPLKDYASSYMYFRYLLDVYGTSGISRIFRAAETGVSGVNKALEVIDPNLLSACGTTTGLTSPYFGCSYRFMWAGLAHTLGAIPATVNVNFNGTTTTMNASGSTNYNWNVTDTAWRNKIAATLAAAARTRPAVATGTGTLPSYAPTLFQTNFPSGAPATFSGCSGCGLTIIAGNNYFAVFNHDVSGLTHSANVIDMQVMANIQAMPDPQNEDSPADLADSRRSGGISWHFHIPDKDLHELKKRTHKKDEKDN